MSSLLSSSRRVLFEACPHYYAFGNTPAHNALEGFHAELGESELLKVLFLGCGDLRNPLTAVTQNGHSGNYQIHVNDNSIPVIGRNVLILKIISSPKFNPEDEEDMAYVWDLWYNATWSKSTLDRFLKDVKSLLNETLPDSIIVPKRSYLEDLKELWTFWISATKSFTCEKVLEDRRSYMIYGFSLITQGRKSSGRMSFSETVETAVQRVERTLLGNINSSQRLKGSQQLLGKVRQELEEYYKTGLSCSGRTGSSSVNPTMLQPVTGKWIVYYSACPVEGYLPIALEELDNSWTKTARKNDGVVFAYCRNELKKLLIAFRKRMDGVKFVFHPCDALAFCFEDSSKLFDVIDTSNLADHVGLVNLLNAAGRKLRSNQSVLITESMKWPMVAQNVAHYVQEMLCCPLSLIPTLYGLRLMDNIELGPEFVSNIEITGLITGFTSRLRWKKALPFNGVPLTLSATLEESLKRLKTACFFPGTSPSAGMASLQVFNSPLTFHYVLSDLIRRGGSPALLDSASLATLPPAFRKELESIQAWKMVDEQPSPGKVWQVEVSIPFNPMDQRTYDMAWSSRGQNPVLRLVLAPMSEFLAIAFGGSSAVNQPFDLSSTVSHFIDHLGLRMKMKPDGGIEEVSLTFLLKDRSLMESHCGMIIDCVTSMPVFTIGPFSDRQYRVKLFDRPYPWTRKEKPSIVSSSGSGSSKLAGQSCEESEGGYSILLKVLHPADCGKAPSCSGLKVVADDRDGDAADRAWNFHRSAHRITLSLDGVEPLTITLPHPILPGTIKATLRRKDGIVEIVASKALRELWPDEENNPRRLRWNAEELQPLTDITTLGVHVGLQFRLDYLKNPSGAGMEDASPLTQVREIIRHLFVRTTKEGQQFYALLVKGSSERDPNLFIRTHPPIRISSRGTPILALSALDNQGKFDDDEGAKDFSRIFPPSERIVSVWALTHEEVELFRYVLRLNSTKIRPTEWQEKNLPKGERGRPWLATFVRPLYRDRRMTSGEELAIANMTIPTRTSAASALGVDADDDRKCCASCRKAAGPLKRCSRCKAVSYCSVECQLADWKSHKSSCVKVGQVAII